MRKNILQDITLTGYFEGKWIRGLEHRVGCIVSRHILIRAKKDRKLGGATIGNVLKEYGTFNNNNNNNCDSSTKYQKMGIFS